MDELIRINFDQEQPTVSARDLHAGLEIATKFATWFQRILDFGFVEGVDYTAYYPNLGSGMHGGQNRIDYQISLDMAKQICMLQRSEKGKLYRQYFLMLEKAWNNPEQIMARALQLADQTVGRLREQCYLLGSQVSEQQMLIESMKPKVNYVDLILQSDTLVLTTQIAKDYGISAVTLNRLLNNMGVQYRVNGQWVLYAKYQGKGYAQSKTFCIKGSGGEPIVKMQTEWTQKGRLFLYEVLKAEGILPLVEKEGEMSAGGGQ